MSMEDLLIYGTIGLVIIVVGYMILSSFTLPQTMQTDSKIFSLKECTSAGFTKQECFKLSQEEIKKIGGKKNS